MSVYLDSACIVDCHTDALRQQQRRSAASYRLLKNYFESQCEVHSKTVVFDFQTNDIFRDGRFGEFTLSAVEVLSVLVFVGPSKRIPFFAG
jgi:hypothetical protein